jgi:hypothetical protein
MTVLNSAEEMFQDIPFVRILAAIACPALLCSCNAVPQWYPSDATHPELPAEILFNNEAGRGESLFITVRSEDGKFWFFGVDTGSSVTVLDKSLEARLGKRLSKKEIPTGWLGKIVFGVYRSPKLFLGKTPLLMGENVWTTDLSTMASSHRMMGILGMDSLHHYCLQLDFTSHKMSFLAPESPEAKLGKAFPLKISQVGVAIQTSFINTNEMANGIDSAEYLDGSLSSEQFQAARKENPQASVRQWTNSTGTVFRDARFATGNFGGETYTNLIVREHSNGGNTIGLHLLAQHLVTFNFPKQTLYLQRRP